MRLTSTCGTIIYNHLHLLTLKNFVNDSETPFLAHKAGVDFDIISLECVLIACRYMMLEVPDSSL